MAKMIPPYISEDVKNRGEKQIFELFEKDPDTSDWIVLHSLGIAKHTQRTCGEIDFVVMAPKLGIFCLEVKSGEVKRENGVWHFTNRYGKTVKKNRSPFEQASDGMYSLIDFLKKVPNQDSDLSNLLFGFGVMFPHIEYNETGTEYEQWQVYDRHSRRGPVSFFIEELARNTKKKMEEKTHFIKKLPSRKDIEKIASILRGNFEILITPKQRLGDTEELILSYTKEQYKFLDHLEDNERCLFQGAAGTGKTMLALESAKRSIYSKKRTLLVCYNILLGNWLKLRLKNNTGENFLVEDFHTFLERIAKINTPIKPSIVQSNDYYTRALPYLAVEALDRGVIEPFDKIIIDEGQDLIRPEYLDVFSELLKGGLSGGNWEIYCDLEQQALFSKYTADTMLKMLGGRAHFAKFKLKVNCRNTKPIGENTARITGFEKPPFLPNNIEGLPVRYFFYKDKTEQIQKLEHILSDLKSKQIPLENISILSRYKLQNSSVSGLNMKKFPFEDITLRKNDPKLFTDCRNISFSTINAFKGLENSYIIITDVHKLKDDNNKDKDNEYRSQLYVAMSRAKVCLYVLADKSCEEDCNRLLKRVKKIVN